MRKLVNTLIAGGFCLGMMLSQTAQAAPASSDEDARVGGGSGGSTVYDFDDDNVDGELLSPDGALVTGTAGAKHANMIKIRALFIPELIKMANDI